MKISVILPVINETFSLKQTIEIILSENIGQEFEFLIVIAKQTTSESLFVIEELKKQYPNIIKVHLQKLPYLGGALQEAFEIVEGEYTILMASDLETDPHTVKKIIEEIKTGYDIVTCSRWREKFSFNGYNPLKLILNKVFQLFFRILYNTKLTDLTFAFRIFKTDILKKIIWQELGHPFLFETIIKPIRLGYKIKEIPSSWVARQEGESQNTFFRNFAYFKIGLKVFLMSKNKIVKYE